MCSFRAGKCDFIAIATHTRWGKSPDGREAELGMLADWTDSHFNAKGAEDRDLIVMGDFNIPALDDALFKALTRRGLQLPDSLRTLKAGRKVVKGSNLGQTQRYNQVLHLPTAAKRFSGAGGIVVFWGGGAALKDLFLGTNYDAAKFTYQMSDHFPVWVQINVDIDGDRLTQIVRSDEPK